MYNIPTEIPSMFDMRLIISIDCCLYIETLEQQEKCLDCYPEMVHAPKGYNMMDDHRRISVVFCSKRLFQY